MRKPILTVLLLAVCLSLQGQVRWESQLWTSAELEYNLKGPWSFAFSPEVRFRLDPFMVRTIFPDVSAAYKFNKQLSAAIHYRYQYTNDGRGDNFTTHSVLADLNYKKKMDDFQFGLRLRGGTIEDGNPDPELLQWQSWEAREKFAVTYDLDKHHQVFANCEFFQLPVESWFILQQYRVAAGMEFEVSKSQKLELGLMYQSRPYLKRINSLITYSLALDKLKGHKKNAAE